MISAFHVLSKLKNVKYGTIKTQWDKKNVKLFSNTHTHRYIYSPSLYINFLHEQTY